jgi:hypothetical protein
MKDFKSRLRLAVIAAVLMGVAALTAENEAFVSLSQ